MSGSNRFTTSLALAFIILSVSLSACADTGTEHETKPLTVGHCPTMSDRAHTINSTREGLILKRFPSTSSAVTALKNGTADIILVGRIVEDEELEDSFESRLREGCTLVGKNKRFVSYEQLTAGTIHTALSEETVSDYFDKEVDITYHGSLGSALDEGLEEAVLINWSEYSAEYDLVIPVDGSMNKIETYRLPVLYSFDKELIEYLTE